MRKIISVGVVGAGQMGAGIAQVAASNGFSTILSDINLDTAKRGIDGISKQLDKLVSKEKISAEQSSKILANLKPGLIADFSNVDIAVEAATENLDIKLRIFRELDAATPKDAILASNTSSISITKIASVTARPSLVVGVHFMNPPPLMKLVELIRGLQTSDETYATVKTWVEGMGKTTATAPDSAGFIVNRILMPMLNEAFFLLQEGAKREDIDTGMLLGTNHPMGPLQLADLIGLDTTLSILKVLHSELGEDKYRPCPLLIKYVEAGWLGRKTKRGFYSY